MGVDEMDEMDRRNIEDILPAGTLIHIDKLEYHTYRLQRIDDNLDMDMFRRSRYPNSYTPFLDEHELEWAFLLVKHGISNKAIDFLMTVHTIKSNLPEGHFKSPCTLGQNIRNIVPDC